MLTLSKFVSDHRERFETTAGNIFAFSWGKVIRRSDFLQIIEARYEASSLAFIKKSEEQQKLFQSLGPGPGPIPAHLFSHMEEGRRLGQDVHLQLESYYLFAKIVLDDIARAIEYYFGSLRGLALDSHDDLTKRIREYAASKQLSVSDELIATIADLKKRVCDFRDQNIAHEKSPRTMQGTTWNADTGARIMATRLYPKDTDPAQIETETPAQIRTTLEMYLDQLVEFITVNQAKTAIKLDEK